MKQDEAESSFKGPSAEGTAVPYTRKRIVTSILCPLFSAFIAVGAYIRIPVPFIPFTLQLLFVLLAGLLLGSKRGALSVLIYLLIGLSGVPVFTAGGGPAYLFHPTFGYLVGFVCGAFLSGWILERSKKQNMAVCFLASLCGLLLVYLFGITHFYFISNSYLGKPLGVLSTLFYGCLVFIPMDLFSCVLASFLVIRFRNLLRDFDLSGLLDR